MPKCGHCKNMGTTLTEIQPAGASYRHVAICCQWCDAILGITPTHNAAVMLEAAQKERAQIKARLADMEGKIDRLLYSLSR